MSFIGLKFSLEFEKDDKNLLEHSQDPWIFKPLIVFNLKDLH